MESDKYSKFYGIKCKCPYAMVAHKRIRTQAYRPSHEKFSKTVNRFENVIYLCLKIAIWIEMLIIFTMFNESSKKIQRGEYH